jgi:hypothetical protein
MFVVLTVLIPTLLRVRNATFESRTRKPFFYMRVNLYVTSSKNMLKQKNI